jgi:hypothetical protein
MIVFVCAQFVYFVRVLIAYCVVCSERRLFELILEYGGPDYFDEDRSNPFRYSMVLCCCQRFGDAIAHLWHCNKALPAVHLTVAALHYGLVLPHVPLDMNPAHPMVMGSRFVHGAAYSAQQDPTPATVLQYFASTPLMQAHPAVVCDYLASMDSHWLAYAPGLEPELKDTMKLKSQGALHAVLEAFLVSLPREQLCEVVGEPARGTQGAQGQGQGQVRSSARTGGRLDDYVSEKQVELLLAKAAYHLLTQRNEAEPAIYLYLMAGRYSDAVEELCNQLAAHLIPQCAPERGVAGNPLLGFGSPGGNSSAYKSQRQQQQRVASHDLNREHWKGMAENFIAQYLQPASGGGGGQSTVEHALAASGARGLVDSLLMLVGLCAFVDHVLDSSSSGAADSNTSGAAAARPLQALRLLDQLQVFPSAESQVDLFAALNPVLRGVVDDLLVMTMECTASAHHALQLERGAAPYAGLTTEKDLQLRALKQRAVALAAFAFKVRARLSRQDTAGVLARMEAAIV